MNKKIKSLANLVAGWEPGNPSRYNHSAPYCSGESLSIKVWSDSKGIHAYCFRCGQKASSNRLLINKPEPIYKKHDITLPKDIVFDFHTFPLEGKVWLTKYGISSQEVKKFRIGYSPQLRRILLPVFYQGIFVGYQSRKIFPSDPRPKYITKTKHPDKFFQVFRQSNKTPYVCLVEDFLSGVKASRVADTVAIFGVHLKTELIKYLISNYSQFFILLDNDNKNVKLKQVKIQQQLSLFGKATVVKLPCDPKELSTEKLNKIITEVVNG